MKSSTQLAKKLSAYSIFTGALLTAAEKSDAQIIYTDVAPDDTIYIDGTYTYLNLDGDNYDELFISGQGFGIFRYWEIDAVGGYHDFGLFGHTYADTLNIGYSLCSSNEHWYFLGLGTGLLIKQQGYNLYGALQPGDTNRFIGISYHGQYTTQKTIGWVRLDVAADTSYLILKDYGYNPIEGACIKTGEGIPSSGCNDAHEPNDFFSEATLIPVNEKIEALIDAPGDKDWFQFTPHATKNNVRIVLKKLPANYNIKLYDQNFQVLGLSKHHGKINDTIVYNNLDPSQHYYIVVRGQNVNAYNASDCYTLKVEASSNPYKLIESSSLQDEIQEVDLFPNPASDKIFISGLNDESGNIEVSVYDLSGRKMFHQKISSTENSLDISSLAEGMYLLQLHYEVGLVVKKFEVRH